MQDKGFTVTGSDQNVYQPMSTFLAAKKIEVMNGYDERNLAPQTRPRRHRQRHFARQSRGGICPRPQTALLFAAGVAEGIFHPRQTLARRQRHARQDHDDLAAGVGV